MEPQSNGPELGSAAQASSCRSLHQRLSLPGLPLAVYREVAAHLQQLPAVTVNLLPQSATTFSYRHSQVGGLQIYCPDADAALEAQVTSILSYYSDRYGAWQVLSADSKDAS